MASDGDGKREQSGEAPLTRAMTYPASRLSAPIELVNMAAEIERADSAIGMVAGGKLELIRDQIRALQEQARALLEEAKRSALLHRAKCNFKKMPGQIYHLYRRTDGDLYFSMLSPDDWRGAPPHAFEGSYRLEADQSFTPLEDTRQRFDPRERLDPYEHPEPRKRLDPRELVQKLLAEGEPQKP